MQIKCQKEQTYNDVELDLLAEIIANFILENILKDETPIYSEQSDSSKLRKKAEGDQVEVR